MNTAIEAFDTVIAPLNYRDLTLDFHTLREQIMLELSVSGSSVMRQVFAFILAFGISLALGYAFLASRTSEGVPGATSLKLVARCELIYFDTRLQPVHTLVLACPRMDMIRLWPLPVQRPWFEDGDPKHAPPSPTIGT